MPIGLLGAQCQCKQQEERWLHHHFEHGIHADFQEDRDDDREELQEHGKRTPF